MELTIKKCPKCGGEDFYTCTTGRASCTLSYSMNKEKEHNVSGHWDWDSINKKEEVRCSDCYLSLRRYII